MFKQSKAMQFWNIFYPICIYFVVTTVALSILDLLLPETLDSKLFRQLITSISAIPFLYAFYRGDLISRGEWTKQTWVRLPKLHPFTAVELFFVGTFFSIALNNLLGMVRITEYSASYAQVTETFYTGRLFLEIIALCIVIPIAEELLYRGVVYGRARDLFGVRVAIFLSAIIFGLIHMNLAQFVYAALFGVLLAYFVERTKSLLSAMLLHSAANLVSVLRAETKVFAFMEQSMGVFAAATIVSALLAVLGIFLVVGRKENR